MATLSVNASLKTNVPTKIAVKGSRMPRTEVLVAPTALVEAANVIVATAVGNTVSYNYQQPDYVFPLPDDEIEYGGRDNEQ